MVDPTTVGVAFVTIGTVMLLLEVAMPGFFLGIPATVLIVLGVLAFLAPSVALSPTWAPLIVIAVGLPATLGTIFAYKKIAPAVAPPTTIAGDSLIGRDGVVQTEIVPESSKGKIKIERQVWSATSDETIPVGTPVRVVRVDGVILIVKKR